jgi:RNA polymerase sigma-70 factor (ECF subfamily)
VTGTGDRAPSPSDELLVSRCRDEAPYGTEAFEQLVRRYEPMVFRSCHHYLGRREDAEEAAQEVLLRVFHGVAGFAGRASLRTWVFRVAMNVCATRRERLMRERERSEQLAFDAEQAHDPRVTREAGEPLEGPVGAALALLSEDDRRTLVLRHVAELSFEELAEVLEVGLSAAKMRLYRSEERFRATWDGVQGKTEEV